MPYEIDYLEDDKIVTIKNSGDLTLADLLEQSKEAVELARRKNARLFLSDNTLLKRSIRLYEIYDLPKIYAEIGASRHNKLAVLIKKGAPITEKARFFEDVCQNRSWNVKVFTTYAAAKRWLRK